MSKSILNKTPKTDWKPGDVCYMYATWSDRVMEAKVESVSYDGQTVTLASLTMDHLIAVPFAKIFPTFDSAMGALCEVNDAIKKEYESGITSVPELLQFALDNTVSQAEEYTDWEARAAFIARARALLGIELKSN